MSSTIQGKIIIRAQNIFGNFARNPGAIPCYFWCGGPLAEPIPHGWLEVVPPKPERCDHLYSQHHRCERPLGHLGQHMTYTDSGKIPSLVWEETPNKRRCGHLYAELSGHLYAELSHGARPVRCMLDYGHEGDHAFTWSGEEGR
jgi:hypothetical protein